MGEQTSELQITYACRSDVGKVRDHNEDYVIVEVPTDPEKRHKGKLFIIADGMGGHQAGEVASERAARTTVMDYYASQTDDVPARLRQAVQAANSEVYQMALANPSRAGMGTTVVLAAVIGNQVHVANVGDSRAYLIRPGSIAQITIDHSFVGEQVAAGILTKEQAKAHPQRNVITRALGSAAAVQVDTYLGTLQEGDAILLCSDGLTEHVSDEALQEVVTRHEPEQAVNRLVELAKEGGGSDNISVIILKAGPSGSPTLPGKPQLAATGGKPGFQAVTAAAPPQRPAAAQRAPKGGSSMIWIAGGGIAALLVVVVIIGAVLVVPRNLTGNIPPSATPTEAAPTALVPTAELGPSPTTGAAAGEPTSTLAPTPMATPTVTVRPFFPKPTLTISPTVTETPTATVTPGSGGGGEPAPQPTNQPPPPPTP